MDFNKINLQDLQLKHQLDVNGANGAVTGHVQIPLPEGRNGFGPGLSLQYSSSSRNSAFGIGWSLAGLSFISLDTKKGSPKYDGTDGYAFNGGISLVPAMILVAGEWKQRVEETSEYWIYFYRQKIEDSFIRFEKWVKKLDRRVHWRTVSGGNQVSVYGAVNGSISHPQKPEQVFIWLLEQQFDDHGNAVWYQYKKEDDIGVNGSVSYEASRLREARAYGFAQRYPEQILFGNSEPLYPDQLIPASNRWMFAVQFDYGQFESRPYETMAPTGVWNARNDPYSIYSAGFEIRTYRLCRRILSYHNIPALSSKPSLTGIFEIIYSPDRQGATITGVSHTAVRRDLISGLYSEQSLPSLTFQYTKPKPDHAFKPGPAASQINVPGGLNSASTRMIDLFGDGLPGILTESANNWYYKKNLGSGQFDEQDVIIAKPSQLKGIYSLGDFDQDGNLNLFSLQGRTAGYYEYDRHRENWSGFRPFKQVPQVSHAKFMDVNGDGFADMVVETADKLTCYPFQGKEGFGKPFEFAKPFSNGRQYAPTVGDDLPLDYFMADMTGDGFPDQVRIRNGRVEYFPNLGNGHFGEMVLMENSPVIDHEIGFDSSRIRLFDLDGNGTADIIYLGRGEISFWYNAQGNSFVGGGRIKGLPYIDLLSSASILDFLGNGTPCLVWSNSLSYSSSSSIQYLELTGGEKPRLIHQLNNGIGGITEIIYGYSGTHYLMSILDGTPWISKIPGHFTVADQKILTDTITNSKVATTYKYFDGHYDGNERSFVCFGRIEQYDAEIQGDDFQTLNEFNTQPSCTKTWLHPGMFGWDLLSRAQYYQKDSKQPLLPFPFFESIEAKLEEEFLVGYKSLAGKIMRQEVYPVQPNGATEQHPFSVMQRTYAMRRIQPATGNNACSFFCYQTEALELAYDLVPDDPRISHQLAMAVDAFGNVSREMIIAYARRVGGVGNHSLQERDYINVKQHEITFIDTRERFETTILYESRQFEVNNVARSADALVVRKDVIVDLDNWINTALAFDKVLPTTGPSVARLTAWTRTYFWNDDLSDRLPLGGTGRILLAHHEESACFNDDLINGVFNGKVTNTMLADFAEGNYLFNEGYWWQQFAIQHFNGPSGFYTLNKLEKQSGVFTSYGYDDYHLSIIEIVGPLGNTTKGSMDYNIVEPYRLMDTNENISEVLYDALGIPVVTTHQGTVLFNGASSLYGHDLIDSYNRRPDESFVNIIADPAAYLQNASTFLYYNLNDFPLTSIRLTRTSLLYDGKGNALQDPAVQVDLDYQDGFGRIIQHKRKVEPGLAFQHGTDGTILLDFTGEPLTGMVNDRWLVSGHTVYNNKQAPIKQFEPFFSDRSLFESNSVLEQYGVSVVQYYDAIGRVVKSLFPDGSFSESFFSPWEVRYFDQNDTVNRSLYKVLREVQPVGSAERLALDKSLAHKETPSTVQFDPMGREIVKIAINNDGTVKKTETVFDESDNPVQVTDARGLSAFEYRRDMLGRLLYMRSADAGEKWNFYNSVDLPIHLWDGRNTHQRMDYDLLGRVLSVFVDGVLGLSQITEKFVYGEDASIMQARERNLLGNLVLHYDQAGVQELKLAAPGNLPMHTQRRLLDQFVREPDWADPSSVNLEPELYTSKYVYDALGRTVEHSLPDETTRRYFFSQGGGLEQLIVSTADSILNEVPILKHASYDARGMRQQILLGNDVEVAYTYDRDSFRMTRLRSRKMAGLARSYQDIRYSYDPMGNLVHMVDDTQQSAAASPQVLQGLSVSAHAEFTYDALYQLTSATGRVHQAFLEYDYANRRGEAGVPVDWIKGTRHISFNNGASIERYTRYYKYDLGGNIISIQHTGATQNWTSQIWTSASSNRSLPLHDSNGVPISNPESFFDVNGNCIGMPHLRSLDWNYRNNISRAVVIDRATQGKPNDEEYYVYGGNGIRVRKVTQQLVDVVNNILELTEKIYLDGCEFKRISRNGVNILKRSTSVISDGVNTIARIHGWEQDVQSRETDNISNKKIHYQLANHLGSASLELDDQGDIITYEEYFPFGGTSFIAGRNKRDIDLKDYRYSGKERDDFTGLYYFGYRYYAHWIGGWINPDPLGPEDDENLYMFVHNNPANLVDPNGLQSTRIPYWSEESSVAAGSTVLVPGVLGAEGFWGWLTFNPSDVERLQSGERVSVRFSARDSTIHQLTNYEYLNLEGRVLTFELRNGSGLHVVPNPPPPRPAVRRPRPIARPARPVAVEVPVPAPEAVDPSPELPTVAPNTVAPDTERLETPPPVDSTITDGEVVSEPPSISTPPVPETATENESGASVPEEPACSGIPCLNPSDGEEDDVTRIPGSGLALAGSELIFRNPSGFTLEVPNNFDPGKIGMYTERIRTDRGVGNRSAVPGERLSPRGSDVTDVIRRDNADLLDDWVDAEAAAGRNRPPGHHVDHGVELQHIIRGNETGGADTVRFEDHRFQPGGINTSQGSSAMHTRNRSVANGAPVDVPAGGIARTQDIGLLRNSEGLRTLGRGAGHVLTIGGPVLAWYGASQISDQRVRTVAYTTAGIETLGVGVYFYGRWAQNGVNGFSSGLRTMAIGSRFMRIGGGVGMIVTSAYSGYKHFQQGEYGVLLGDAAGTGLGYMMLTQSASGPLVALTTTAMIANYAGDYVERRVTAEYGRAAGILAGTATGLGIGAVIGGGLVAFGLVSNPVGWAILAVGGIAGLIGSIW